MRTEQPGRKAHGIVRVSQRAGREGDSFVSPTEQTARIEGACERDELALQKIVEEIDISGGKPLEQRPGLLAAVEAVEAGEIDVVVVAYFDRLVRSLRVQGEVVSRVEAAGGQVLAIDVGAVSEKTAGQWLSGTMLGAVSEYQRRSSGERSAEAQADAVARGVPPFPGIVPGYRRKVVGTDQKGRTVFEGPLLPHPAEAMVVSKAFEMRDEKRTIKEIRAFLRKNGIERSYHGVGSLLESTVVLGELHFGSLENLKAHKAIVDRDLWRRVQRVKVARGRKPKSDRLLARLGVLRCGTCNARMVIGTVRSGSYPFYRCPPNGDCPRRVTISARIVEEEVTRVIKGIDVSGRASVADKAQRAEADREKAQADLDAAIRAFAGVDDEAVAQERLAELRAVRDEAEDRASKLRGAGGSIAVSSRDWDNMTLDERRGLVLANIGRITVGPGRGSDRITIELLGE